MAHTHKSFIELADCLSNKKFDFSEELKKAGEEIAEKARSLAPVGSGELQSSIHSDLLSETSVQIAADADYAAVVEFGSTKQAAQPFLMPPLDRKQVMDAIREGVRRSLND